jgi:hypothetical protein
MWDAARKAGPGLQPLSYNTVTTAARQHSTPYIGEKSAKCLDLKFYMCRCFKSVMQGSKAHNLSVLVPWVIVLLAVPTLRIRTRTRTVQL